MCLVSYFALLSSPLPRFQPVVSEQVKAVFLWKLLQLVLSQSWKEKGWE